MSTDTASTTPAFRYSPTLADTIETKWQSYWDEQGTFIQPNPGDAAFDASKPKFYCLDMFPYPSGAGLHVGHPEGYTATDIVCRYMRMTGHNVLHPMGWDAFGLPAEQYAIQTGVHPAETTTKAINTFRRQLKRFGFCYDWSREFATIDPDYYKWTQWIWLKAYDAWYDPWQDKARPIGELINELEGEDLRVGPEGDLVHIGHEGASIGALGSEPVGTRRWHELDEPERREVIDNQRLAYLDEVTVNWCPKLGTVLANEEVIDGRSERGSHPVTRRPLKQWMFRITAYAERLLADLADVDWPTSTKTLQANWIGRSEGAEINFQLADEPGGWETLRVYTTRPDTLFGASYMVVAPEHPLVESVLASSTPPANADEVRAYVETARNKSDVDRQAETKIKTGVALGIDAINPANDQRVPVWVADYVLMGYGHGAIMAVPAHDERDHAFARTFNLPIVQVISAPDGHDIQAEAYAGDGVGMNSSNSDVSLDGLGVADAKAKTIEWLEAQGHGIRTVNYRLRDWLFSRQRYWGEPFPVVYTEDGRHWPIGEESLPVTLPELTDYQPAESDDPQPLLGKATDWVRTTAGEAGVCSRVLPPDTPVMRETNTMPGWAGSCWYYLRYCDPKNDSRFVGTDAEDYWLGANGVDLYIGGAEHAVLHLLYARFWHKLLFDLGEVSSPEPFKKLFHQGLITSFAFQRKDKTLVPTDQVEEPSEGSFIETATGEPVAQITAKMSKSLKNVVNPDDVIAEFGADTFRLYEMYMGPLEASKPWNTRDTVGLFRFLQRAWRVVVDEETGELSPASSIDEDVDRALHKAIAKVREDIPRLAFNTAIAAMIELVNAATTSKGNGGGLTTEQIDQFARILSPFAPHMGEEIWSKLGNSNSIADVPFPEADQSKLVADTIEIPVQIMGKVRGKIVVPPDADEDALKAAATADERIAELLEGKTIRKWIVIPGRMVNIVAN